MGILLVLTASLMFWVAAWAFGIKSFDAFMLVMGVMVVAFAVRLVTPFVREQLGR